MPESWWTQTSSLRGSRVRRRLLQLLGGGEASVSELAENFPVSRSAISQHLLLLADVGLVQARKDGRRRYYSLDPRGMSRLRDSLERFWTSELDILAAEAAALTASTQQPHHPQENFNDH
ncbi:ArsR/SmtB family transcription factor [Arthrobacter sp. H14-L1]|uniref:ArsR/SmtB family transcription factor n=1 Tax=Arthrobacter sp. H14-L1 TaxID=2996697 RepID=UPI0022701231|nr:metalloregulator ArsR/SmtB family transcription factor [Arthrobacter sp. H14-L1]MCY0905977.1 metalloregulator ArsR/SmtB family transcription factor [Arthrobacter sp. H14-L1]